MAYVQSILAIVVRLLGAGNHAASALSTAEDWSTSRFAYPMCLIIGELATLVAREQLGAAVFTMVEMLVRCVRNNTKCVEVFLDVTWVSDFQDLEFDCQNNILGLN